MKTFDFTTKHPSGMPKNVANIPLIKLLLSKIPANMRESMMPSLFPHLAAHMTEATFLYTDNTFISPYMMDLTCICSGGGKSSAGKVKEAIDRDLLEHDRESRKKLADWQKKRSCAGANKTKEPRPDDASLWKPDADMTKPAMLLNMAACELDGKHPMLIETPEVDMLNQLAGGHKMVSKALRVFGDEKPWGAVRATADGVTVSPVMGVCMDNNGTEETVRQFFRSDLHTGGLWRVAIAYTPRADRLRKIPRQGTIDEAWLEKLDGYLGLLKACKGQFQIKPLIRLMDTLREEICDFCDLADDDDIDDCSKRSATNAFRKGCVLWVANGMKWTKAIEDAVRYFFYLDIWSKMRLFKPMLEKALNDDADTTRKGGVKNMLDSLPDSFSEPQLEALRSESGKPKEGTKDQLRVWRNRGFIEYSAQTQLYTKTATYLNR